MFRRSDGFADSQLSPIPASPNRSSSIVHQEMTFDLGQSTKLPFRSNISAISRPPTALQNSQIGSSSRFGDMRSRGQSASSDNETNLLLKASVKTILVESNVLFCIQKVPFSLSLSLHSLFMICQLCCLIKDKSSCFEMIYLQE